MEAGVLRERTGQKRMLTGVLSPGFFVVTAVTAELIPLDAVHKATLLDAHNDARCAVGVADLLWNDADETSAAEWAANCVYQHSTRDQREGRGENLAAAMGQGFPAVLSGANRGWIDQERPNWPCETGAIPNCEPVPGAVNTQCGHYTQVVWDATTTMGCAHALCTDNNPFGQQGEWRLTVCQFSPGGNMMGARPFPVGQCEGASTCGAAEAEAAAGAEEEAEAPAVPGSTDGDAAAGAEAEAEAPAVPGGADGDAAAGAGAEADAEADAAQGVATAAALSADSEVVPEDPDDGMSTVLVLCLAAAALAAISVGAVHFVRRRRGQDTLGKSEGDIETWGNDMFTELDTDGSGALDKQEMLKACAQRGLSVSAAFIDGIWDVLDKDASGGLELEEFKNALAIIERKSSSACGSAASNPDSDEASAPTPSAAEHLNTVTVTRRAPPDLSLIKLGPSEGVTPPVSMRERKTKLPPPPLDDVKDRKRPPPQLPQRRPDLALPARRSQPQPALPARI